MPDPVETKQRTVMPWWIWAIAIALAILLAWWLIDGLSRSALWTTERDAGAIERPAAAR